MGRALFTGALASGLAASSFFGCSIAVPLDGLATGGAAGGGTGGGGTGTGTGTGDAGASNCPNACNDEDPCTDDVCGPEGCTNEPAADGTPCNDDEPCSYDDQCKMGACKGTPIACENDVCGEKACNGTSECTVTPLGQPVFESEDDGWHYDVVDNGTEPVWRLPPDGDKVLHLLHSPCAHDKMQSKNPNEASDCNILCGCACPCAYEQTGLTMSVWSSQQPGQVALYRWKTDVPLAHRSHLTSPAAEWMLEDTLGYVCPP